MRYFNTFGPVNTAEHYVVSRGELIADLVNKIEQGKYFTIFASRQMGKTTVLHDLEAALNQQRGYLVVTLSFENFETAEAHDFLHAFWIEFGDAVRKFLETHADSQLGKVQECLRQSVPQTFLDLIFSLDTLHALLPAWRVVLIIDEFDGIPQAAISPFLQTFRKIYLSGAPPCSLQSVVLVGLQNIAKLNLGRSSPFNIANQIALPGFTITQVTDLLAQYTAESDQPFPADVIAEIQRLTAGHPFLVNRLAAIVTEEIARDRLQAVTLANIETAYRRLIRESNYNFETLIRRAQEYQLDVINILFGASYQFNLNDPVIRDLQMYGVISSTAQGDCQIADPIYAAVLLAAFRPVRSGFQADILVNGYDFRPHRVNGQLQMDVLLSRFRAFVERRGREAFKVTPMPQEATGQYLLMAYLSLVVRHLGGDLFTEVNSGERRMDVIVVHQEHQYIVETKIWRGPQEYDDGLQQLADYLETEGEQVGYYVVFHARPNVYGKLTPAELEFTVPQGKAQIHVYLVQLGDIFPDDMVK